MIQRTLTEAIQKAWRPGFIVIIYGPRRVGKTVFLQQLLEQYPVSKLVLNGDTLETQELLGTTSETKLSRIVADYDLLAIDEAQRISNIGLVLKILIDKFPQKRIIVTGSASLELAKGVPEVLTGRTIKFRLYPLSTLEIAGHLKDFEKPYLLEEQLLYGGYPYLCQLTSANEKVRYLDSLVKDYLLRDILKLKEVAEAETLRKLATLLAFQIGSEVSFNELSNKLSIDIKTVTRYISLLKLGFVIWELSAFSRNLRREVTRGKKYYFWDLGIRNALIGQFMPLDSRNDLGALWENFLALERFKKHEYSQNVVQTYFWRTYEGSEIDWVEIQNGMISAYEFKWQAQKPHTPKAFRDTYSSEINLISRENYLEFLT